MWVVTEKNTRYTKVGDVKFKQLLEQLEPYF